MTKVIVTDEALREMMREAMFNKEFSGWSSNDEGPAQVDPNVDPSQAVTNPINPNFKPHDKTQFGVAVNQLVKNLPDTQMPGLFDTVKTAIEQQDQKEEEDEMKKKVAAGGTGQVEEAVRKAVRNVIAKMPIAEAFVDPADVDEEEPEETPRTRKANRASGFEDQADWTSFEDIANEMGMSVSGAKQAVDKAFGKWKYRLTMMDPVDVRNTIMTAMRDAIKQMEESGEYSAADIQLLKDHPAIVEELDWFRDYLADYFPNAAESREELEDDYGEEPSETPEAGEEPVEAPVGEPRPVSAAPVPKPAAAAPAGETPSGRARREKDTYKVYNPYKGRAVVRVANKLYGTEMGGNLAGGGKTAFKGGERARISRDGDKIKIGKTDSDHSQTWDPIDQAGTVGEAFWKMHARLVKEALKKLSK